MRLRLFFIILISYVGIETMYSVNVSQVATVSFEGVISDIGSKDPLSFATVQLLHGDEVHSILSKDNGEFSFPSLKRPCAGGARPFSRKGPGPKGAKGGYPPLK